jgi:AAA domain
MSDDRNQSFRDDASLRKAILNPVQTTPVEIRANESVETYLSKCMRNIKAELWGLFLSKTQVSFRNWRDSSMDRVYIVERERTVISAFQDSEQTKELDLKELRWNLVLWNDHLYLLLPKREGEGSSRGKDSNLVLAGPGLEISDRFRSGGADYMHLLGYAQTYYAEMGAVQQLQARLKGPERDFLLSMVASPETRARFPYVHDSQEFSAMVPINDMQRTIIRGLKYRIECIQGPPGTGKSTTIFHILQSVIPETHHAIVTCVQNKALDSIVEKLGPTGFPFVVYGNPSRLGDCAKAFLMSSQVMRHPQVVLSQRALDVAVRNQAGIFKHMSWMDLTWMNERGNRWTRFHQRMVEKNSAEYQELKRESIAINHVIQGMRVELMGYKQEAEMELRLSSRASLSTIDGLAAADISHHDAVVIIDEAGTVPEFKIPLLLAMNTQAVIAIGDQNQLQPFSHASRDGEAFDGFFQRVVKALGGSVPMLTEQYRMHPDICSLVSSNFYSGQLVTAEPIRHIRKAVQAGGVAWWGYPDTDAESPEKTKKFNMVEVNLIRRFVRYELPELLAAGKSVAIITFYKQQFLELMKVGEQEGMVKTREEVKHDKTGSGRFKNAGFRIVTVDSAQGSEADVVVLSCVRCNRRSILGFISDRNRQCVALSRARERLIVVGSQRTLMRDLTWDAVIRACKDSE